MTLTVRRYSRAARTWLHSGGGTESAQHGTCQRCATAGPDRAVVTRRSGATDQVRQRHRLPCHEGQRVELVTHTVQSGIATVTTQYTCPWQRYRVGKNTHILRKTHQHRQNGASTSGARSSGTTDSLAAASQLSRLPIHGSSITNSSWLSRLPIHGNSITNSSWLSRLPIHGNSITNSSWLSCLPIHGSSITNSSWLSCLPTHGNSITNSSWLSRLPAWISPLSGWGCEWGSFNSQTSLYDQADICHLTDHSRHLPRWPGQVGSVRSRSGRAGSVTHLRSAAYRFSTSDRSRIRRPYLSRKSSPFCVCREMLSN